MKEGEETGAPGENPQRRTSENTRSLSPKNACPNRDSNPHASIGVRRLLGQQTCLEGFVCLLVDCLTSQQHASVSQGRTCSDNFTCCHTEIEVADRTFCLTQSWYTDTGPTSCRTDLITPGAWQGSHWSANFEVTGMTRPQKNLGASGIRTRDLPLSRRTP